MNIYEKRNEEKKRMLAEQLYKEVCLKLNTKLHEILFNSREGMDITNDLDCLSQEVIGNYKSFMELFDYKEKKKEEPKLMSVNLNSGYFHLSEMNIHDKGLGLVIVQKYKEFKSVRAVKDYLDSTGRIIQDKQIRRVLEKAGLYTTKKRTR